MPTKRTPVERGRRGAPIDETVWRYLHDEDVDLGFDEFTMDLPALWSAHGEQVMRTWVVEHPGTRPSCWWKYDPPEPSRHRLSGKGTPCHDGVNVAPSFFCGIPTRWIDSDLISYYSTQDGKPYAFAASFDRADVPVYESQAAFLLRHGLLLPGERERLTPADFAPEPLPHEYWPPEPTIAWRRCPNCGDTAGDHLKKCQCGHVFSSRDE